MRTGRCETFADVPGRDGRAPLAAPGARRAHGASPRRDGHPPLGGLEGPAHHRHAALPPKRPAAAVRRLAEQHVRSPRPRRDQRPRPGDRGRRRVAQLPARAPRALVQLAVRGEREHRAAFRPDPDLHALLSPLRRSRRVRVLGRVRGLRPLPVRHRLDHREHPDLVERPAAHGLPHGGDQDLRRPARARRGTVAGGVRRVPDRPPRPRLRRRRARGAAPAQTDRGELLARAALRPARRADRLRPRCARFPRASGSRS